MLYTVYTFPVHFRRKKHLHIEIGKGNSPYIEDDSHNQVTLEVSPIHLAIISKQESSLQALLQWGTSQEMSSVGVETNQLKTTNDLFDTKVKVNFQPDDQKSYDNLDLMLDGMNILHLAAKYYPSGLEKIIQLSQKHKGLFEQVNKMLVETDREIKNTPLHTAAYSSSIVALR